MRGSESYKESTKRTLSIKASVCAGLVETMRPKHDQSTFFTPASGCIRVLGGKFWPVAQGITEAALLNAK